jgi:hypothetical protein
MKGDFSRETFDPKKHYSRVLMQQGRVQLDADWNEQMSIMLHTLRAMARDIFGAHGGPAGGFELEKDKDNTALIIKSGRYYVNGLLIESDGSWKSTQKDLVVLTKQVDQTPSEDRMSWGKLLEKGDPFLLFLDVWERHVTALEDPGIREVAVGSGGPDTCTRAKVEWQVKALLKANSCIDANSLDTLSTGKMKAKAETPKGPLDACPLPPEARYRGRENQLYRVEIHNPGTAEKATFKWSRDNGSVVFAVRSLSSGSGQYVVILEGLGRDSTRSLDSGQWVELLDMDDPAPDPKPLMKVVKVEPDSMAVTLKGMTTLTDKNRLLMRRWDQTRNIQENGNDSGVGTEKLSEDIWLGLEYGVQVRFEPAGEEEEPRKYRSGDYWLIPARTATGMVEWPRSNKPTANDPDSEIAAVEAHGVTHHYAPLATVSVNGTGITVSPCRCIVQPQDCPHRYEYGKEAIGPDF